MAESTCPSCAGPVDAKSGVCPACATHVHSASATQPIAESDPQFPGYRLIRPLGEGGMGAVFLAEEESLGRNVALKVISRRIAGDAQSKARFLREARTLATIEHSNVVRVYSIGETPNGAFLVMEYVEGETLTERLMRVGPMDVREVLRMASDICDALEAAWERRIVHRDIKPSNILIDRRNQIRVADFGLAKPIESTSPADSGLTQSGYMLGTPHYLSPEQAQGGEVDCRSDIYALGIMLFQMLTGERPFEGTTPVAIVAKHLHQPLPSVRERRAEVSEEVESLIRWMTAKNREDRPASYAALREEISTLLSSWSGGLQPAERIGEPKSGGLEPAAPTKRLDWAVLAIVVIVFAALMLIPGKRPPAAKVVEAAPDDRLVVAVAPFYGPDADSAKEGRVMAALIERAVQQRIGPGNARVIGIEETKMAVRDHAEARKLGQTLQANAVIWGEAFALRNETEVEPHVTIVQTGKAPQKSVIETDRRKRIADDPMQLTETDSGPLRLDAEAPNQIEMRKTSASGVGDIVVMVAAIHALESKGDAARALELLATAPKSVETVRYEAKAFLQLGDHDKARAKLEESLVLDPSHAQTLATLGDIEIDAGRYQQAFSLFERAAASGKPFTSFRGFVQGSRMYTNEFFVSYGINTTAREEPTIYLLGIDPATGRTISRVALPGFPSRFLHQGAAVTIFYESDRQRRNQNALVLREGVFEQQPMLPPGPYPRIRSAKSGSILADNFLGEFERPRSQAGAPPARLSVRKANDMRGPTPDLPTTLPDLETALRAAIARDATQPWHRFFLALTLRELGKEQEAEREFQQMLQTKYPGTPYYEFASMMSFLERMRFYPWEDALYPKALAQRKLVTQPAGVSMLIERIFNAPFTRSAVANRDMARGRLALERARALAGLSVESEDVVAATWAQHFRSIGDRRQAEEEMRIVERLRREPLNLAGAVAQLDYLLVCTFAAWISFAILMLFLVSRSMARVRRSTVRPRSQAAGLIALLLQRVPRSIAIAVATALIGSAIAGLAWATASEVIDGFWVFLLLSGLAAAYLLRVFGIGPLAFAAATQRNERHLLALASLAAVTFTIITSIRLAHLGVLFAVPLGTGDALGHPEVVAELEDRLAQSDRPVSFWVTAAANHYGGNFERASELYSKIASDPRAPRNLAAVERHQPPAEHPSTVEIGRAFMSVDGWDTLTEAARSLVNRHGVIVGLVLMLVGIALLSTVRPEPEYAVVAAPPDGIIAKLVMLLIPGVYDVRRGKPWLGYAVLFAAAFLVLPSTVLFNDVYSPGASPFSSDMLPSIGSTQPMPVTPGKDPFVVAGLAVRLAFPWAHLFWSAFVIALVLAIGVHLWRIPRILRTPGRVGEVLKPLPSA